MDNGQVTSELALPMPLLGSIRIPEDPATVGERLLIASIPKVVVSSNAFFSGGYNNNVVVLLKDSLSWKVWISFRVKRVEGVREV